MSIPEPKHNPVTGEARFASTHWSVVLAAAGTSSPEAQAALDKLCVAYWYPLYAYLRRRGHPPAESEDLTQDFFASHVITKRIFRGADPSAGRFRSWLLTSLQNLVKNEWEKQNTIKRGGRSPHLPLDFESAEGRYLAEPAHDLTPEKLYDRAWAQTVVELVLDRLRAKYVAEEKASQFEQLRLFLPGEQSPRSYAEVAAIVLHRTLRNRPAPGHRSVRIGSPGGHSLRSSEDHVAPAGGNLGCRRLRRCRWQQLRRRRWRWRWWWLWRRLWRLRRGQLIRPPRCSAALLCAFCASSRLFPLLYGSTLNRSRNSVPDPRIRPV